LRIGETRFAELANAIGICSFINWQVRAINSADTVSPDEDRRVLGQHEPTPSATIEADSARLASCIISRRVVVKCRNMENRQPILALRSV